MGETTRRIEPEAISESAWQPFGWLPVPDTDPEDGSNRLAYEWADPHVNIIGHRRDEVPVADGALRCEVLFRHLTHTQVVMPLDVDAVIAVSPAGNRPADGGGRGADPGVRPARAPARRAGPGHLALGTVPRPGARRSGSSTSRACATQRTTIPPTWRRRARR